jgi:hypothetical protein
VRESDCENVLAEGVGEFVKVWDCEGVGDFEGVGDCEGD